MLSIAVQRNEGERRKAYFVCVYSLLTQCEGVIAAAVLGDVGEETPVHEYVPGEGVRGGDDSRHHPQTEDGQIESTLIQEWQRAICRRQGEGGGDVNACSVNNKVYIGL